MKGIKTILGIALATTGFGGAIAVGAVSATQSNRVEQTEAASTTRLYLDMSGFSEWYSDNASFKVHTWNSANGDQYFSATKVGNAYYYADVDLATYANGGGYRFTRFNSSGSSEYNRGEWRSYSAGIATYYRASNWSAGTWSTDDQKTWTIVGSTTGEWTSQTEDISIPLTKRFDGEGLQFINTSVSLSAGSVFKVKSSSNDYYGYNCIETYDGDKSSVIATGDVSGEGGSNITVVNSGSYEVYMKPFAGKFWMQENSEATATAWATSFLSATGTICSNGGESADHLTQLQGIWSAQKGSFDDLTLGARGIIKAGTANATIKDAHDRYVHIMTRYAGSLDAFNDWEIGGSGSRNIVQLTNNNVALFALIASFVAVSSIGLFFVIKKKKHI